MRTAAGRAARAYAASRRRAAGHVPAAVRVGRAGAGRRAYGACVPEQAEPPSPGTSDRARRRPAPAAVVRPDGRGAVRLPRHARAGRGRRRPGCARRPPSAAPRSDRRAATVLADRLVTAGRAGGPPPARVPPHLIEVWAERDLYAHAHRAAYTGLAATVDAGIDGPRRRALRAAAAPGGLAGLRGRRGRRWRRCKRPACAIGVVSNIGFDIRPICAAFGLADCRRVRAVVRGRPAASRTRRSSSTRAPRSTSTRSDTLMVGDTPGRRGRGRARLRGVPGAGGRSRRVERPRRCALSARSPGVTLRRARVTGSSRRLRRAAQRARHRGDGHRQRARPLAVDVRGDALGVDAPPSRAR